MLPQTQYNQQNPQPYESINDLAVHFATTVQIFHPTSESRKFTRADAAKVFDENLLPTDHRVPHPELAVLQRLSPEEQKTMARAHEQEALKKRQLADASRAQYEASLKRVDTGRFLFRFREISVDAAGVDGRGPHGTGWRYGVPHMDRSKGKVKIPTRVD